MEAHFLHIPLQLQMQASVDKVPWMNQTEFASEVLVSDSIPSKSSDRLKVISCDKLIAKAIWGLASKKSINEINSI